MDDFESQLERSFSTDPWVESKRERAKAKGAALMSKSERTNIRLSTSDLQGIKQKAQEKGLGYQTLIASLVHQFVSGNLIEMSSVVEKAISSVARGAKSRRSSRAR